MIRRIKESFDNESYIVRVTFKCVDGEPDVVSGTDLETRYDNPYDKRYYRGNYYFVEKTFDDIEDAKAYQRMYDRYVGKSFDYLTFGESVKRSDRRRSNRMNEAQSYSGGFTVQDVANVAVGGTKVEIYNRKSENYIAYQEYLKDVVRDNPEIASCEVLYLSARGNNRLILEVNCDYTQESKNWR